MALPSSPSIPSDQHIPSSPPLLPLPSSLFHPGARKRQFSDYGSQSSDPIFSDATTDTEQLPSDRDPTRKKRFVQGPWWKSSQDASQAGHLPMKRKNMNALRNTDSGVWMGSDEDIVSTEVPLPLTSAKQDMTDRSPDMKVRPKKEPVIPQPEHHAARTILRLADEGSEVFDLSGLGLQTLSNATLRPLHHMVRSSHVTHISPPSEDEFVPLTPSIQLYLANNSLARIPHDIFNLNHLTVLSLRNNLVKSIPFAIGRLTGLKEINISGNLVKYLPFELLDILSPAANRRITLRPNPFFLPMTFEGECPVPDVLRGDFRKKNSWHIIGDPYRALQEFRVMLKYHGIDELNMWAELESRLFLGRWQRSMALEDRDEAKDDDAVPQAAPAGAQNNGTAAPNAYLAHGLRDLEDEDEDEDEYEYDEYVDEDEEPNEPEPEPEPEPSYMTDLVYLASSQIRYFEVDGRTPTPSYGHTISHEPDWTPVFESACPAVPNATSVPSLFELALRNVQRNYDLNDAVDVVNLHGATNLVYPLQHAAENVDRGYNSTCSVCGAFCVLPRAEWVEYWFYGPTTQVNLTNDTVLPFLRNACSWACAKPSKLGDCRL